MVVLNTLPSSFCRGHRFGDAASFPKWETDANRDSPASAPEGARRQLGLDRVLQRLPVGADQRGRSTARQRACGRLTASLLGDEHDVPLAAAGAGADVAGGDGEADLAQ